MEEKKLFFEVDDKIEKLKLSGVYLLKEAKIIFINAVSKYNLDHALGIVMNLKTWEILAISSRPNF